MLKLYIVEELSPALHDELNPAIWKNGYELRDDVQQKIQELVQEFIGNLDYDLPVLDVQLVGSNASYNYTSQSDVDVHIITSFEGLGQPAELVKLAMDNTKANFNKDYDISYNGFDVEIYVDDVKSTCTSNGIYSVTRKQWVKVPQKLENIQVELDPLLRETRKETDMVLKSDDAELITKTVNDLYLMRRDSLATDGEFGVGNLVFKQIRNDGLLDGLKNKLKSLRSEELSI